MLWFTMPLRMADPMLRAALGVIYQFDVAMTPEVAAANFTISVEEARFYFSQLEELGMLREVDENLYEVTRSGRRAVKDTIRYRGAAPS